MSDSSQAGSAWQRWLSIPEVPRIVPFAVFMLFTVIPAEAFPGAEYWLYAAKAVAVGVLLWLIRGWLPEMKWAVSWEALVVGVLIAVIWLGIPELKLPWEYVLGGKEAGPDKGDPWNPLAHFQDNAALGWAFLLVRIICRSTVVPMVEEVFYRGFVYRFIASPKFTEVPFGRWHAGAFFITAVMFGFAHGGHWLQGIACAMAYQWLVLRKQRLGDAMTAHAVTNLIISVYAVATNRWEFT